MLDYDRFSTGFLITKASRIVLHMYQKELSQYSITPPQSSILWILSKMKEVSQTEIVRALMLDKANVSALVRKLKDDGYIDVRPADNDGRKSILTLTSRGKDIVKKIDKIDKKISNYIENTSNNGDLKHARGFLNSILQMVQ